MGWNEDEDEDEDGMGWVRYIREMGLDRWVGF